MKTTAWIASAAAGLLINAVLATASQAEAAKVPEAAIQFANHGGIRDWNALDDNGIWVQGNSNKWYYATFIGPCTGLRFETTVAFVPGANGTLDRWSAVKTHNTGRCQFKSMTASDTPPPSLRKPKE
jgi:Family of unknown function (DUF6491)